MWVCVERERSRGNKKCKNRRVVEWEGGEVREKEGEPTFKEGLN